MRSQGVTLKGSRVIVTHDAARAVSAQVDESVDGCGDDPADELAGELGEGGHAADGAPAPSRSEPDDYDGTMMMI